MCKKDGHLKEGDFHEAADSEALTWHSSHHQSI